MSGGTFVFLLFGILLFLVQVAAGYVVISAQLVARIRARDPEAWHSLGSPADSMAMIHRGSMQLAAFILLGNYRTLDDRDVTRLGGICKALLVTGLACGALLVVFFAMYLAG